MPALQQQRSALADVLAAVYGAVNRATLPDNAVIVDGASEGQTFPYVTFGEGTREDPDDVLGESGRAVSVVLEVWVKEGGHQQAARIASTLVVTVTTGMSVDSWELEDIEYRGAGPSLRLPDGIIRHLPVAFRIRVAEP